MSRDANGRRRARARRVVLAVAVVLGVFTWPAAVEAVRDWPWDWPHWRDADWSSAGLLPDPATETGAYVAVLNARSAEWRGWFSTHPWIVAKPERATAYTRWEVLGWGRALRRDAYPPDGRWFGNDPAILFELRGAEAARAIPAIEAAVAAYPAADRYRMWPGPNSNSFVAHVARAVPELAPVLPHDAVGKDFLLSPDGEAALFSGTPSGTGWQVSLYGLAGATLAWREGIAVNLLGLSAGVPLRE